MKGNKLRLKNACSAAVLMLVAGCMVTQAHAQRREQGMEEMWSNSCLRCHGKAGEGGPAGTSTLLTVELMDQSLDKRFYDAIKDGHKDGGMPGFGDVMQERQMWSLVVYIRELQLRNHRQELQATDAQKSGGGVPRVEKNVYQAKDHAFKVEDVVSGGLAVPWSVDFLPSGEMLVAERQGRLRIAKNGNLGVAIKGVPVVRNRGQGGLMDVAVHPNFEKNKWVYLSFSDPKKKEDRDNALGMTKIVRGRIKNGVWTDEQVIFEAKEKDYLETDLHFGCRIVFAEPTPDGKRYLYFAIGERGRQDHAQDLKRPNGKIYRLFDDGKVPQDNPFVGQKDVYEGIWSYGHRNPQGLALGTDGLLWDTEHGPRGGDEVNLIEKGKNYGWPLVSFGVNYSGSPFKTPWPEASQEIAMPVYRWLPSTGACGLDVSRGEGFAKWKGDLIAGGLAGENVDRLRIKDGKLVEREELLYGMGRVRDVVCGPDGNVYVVLNAPDKVIRLTPVKN